MVKRRGNGGEQSVVNGGSGGMVINFSRFVNRPFGGAGQRRVRTTAGCCSLVATVLVGVFEVRRDLGITWAEKGE